MLYGQHGVHRRGPASRKCLLVVVLSLSVYVCERAKEDSRSRFYSARKEVRGSEASLELDGEFLQSQSSDSHTSIMWNVAYI